MIPQQRGRMLREARAQKMAECQKGRRLYTMSLLLSVLFFLAAKAKKVMRVTQPVTLLSDAYMVR